MTTTHIALLSSSIGAGTSILVQFIVYFLRNKTDKQNIIFDLIAEERKLAQMILLNQIAYCKIGFTIEYYYQLAVINQDIEQAKTDIERHHEEIKNSNKLHAEYTVLVGDYCKNIYKLILYIKHSKELEEVLQKILRYNHEDVVGVFDNFSTYPKLYEAYSKKQYSVSASLETYETYFKEMRQIIEQSAQ